MFDECLKIVCWAWLIHSIGAPFDWISQVQQTTIIIFNFKRHTNNVEIIEKCFELIALNFKTFMFFKANPYFHSYFPKYKKYNFFFCSMKFFGSNLLNDSIAVVLLLVFVVVYNLKRLKCEILCQQSSRHFFMTLWYFCMFLFYSWILSQVWIIWIATKICLQFAIKKRIHISDFYFYF